MVSFMDVVVMVLGAVFLALLVLFFGQCAGGIGPGGVYRAEDCANDQVVIVYDRKGREVERTECCTISVFNGGTHHTVTAYLCGGATISLDVPMGYSFERIPEWK